MYFSHGNLQFGISMQEHRVMSDRCSFWILHVGSEVIHAEHKNIYCVFLNSQKDMVYALRVMKTKEVLVSCIVSRDGSFQI